MKWGLDAAQGTILHPLDWTSHLRQHLVVDPLPTFVTLLLVSAHFYSSCGNPQVVQKGTNNNSTSTAYVSVLGTLFEGLSAAAEVIETLSFVPFTSGGSVCSIQTPLSRVKENSRTLSERQQHGHKDSSSSSSGSLSNGNIKDTIMSAAMTDPMSMMYDMWWYLSTADVQVVQPRGENAWKLQQQQQQRADEPPETTIDDESCSGTGQQHDRLKQDAAEGAARLKLKRENMWLDACIMHALALGGVAVSLGPSMICPRSSLACSGAVEDASPPWAVLNSCVLVTGMSLVACCALHHICGMHMLALCTSMHSACRILFGYASMCVSCPLPPIMMPGVAASGMVTCVGLVALFVSRIPIAGEEGDFYMCHAWACCMVVWGIRHSAFRAAVWFTSLLVGLCTPGQK